jgi:general secretion pathway protein I
MRRGFTLLEVLVATLIMAIAVAGVLGALSTSLRNASRISDADTAALLAKRKLDELLVEERLPKGVVVEGAFPDGRGWRARVSKFEMPPGVSPGVEILERIEVEVWWLAGEQRRTFNVEGYRRSVLR